MASETKNSIIVGSASRIPVRLISTKSNTTPGEEGSPVNVCAVLCESPDRLDHQIHSQQRLPSPHWFIPKSSCLQQPDGETSWISETEREQPQLLLPCSPGRLCGSAAPELAAAVMSSRQMLGNIWRTDVADSNTVKRKVRESVSGAFRAHSQSGAVLP